MLLSSYILYGSLIWMRRAVFRLFRSCYCPYEDFGLHSNQSKTSFLSRCYLCMSRLCTLSTIELARDHNVRHCHIKPRNHPVDRRKEESKPNILMFTEKDCDESRRNVVIRIYWNTIRDRVFDFHWHSHSRSCECWERWDTLFALKNTLDHHIDFSLNKKITVRSSLYKLQCTREAYSLELHLIQCAHGVYLFDNRSCISHSRIFEMLHPYLLSTSRNQQDPWRSILPAHWPLFTFLDEA